MEPAIGKRGAHERKDLAHEPRDRVGVRRMLEAADEDEIAPFARRPCGSHALRARSKALRHARRARRVASRSCSAGLTTSVTSHSRMSLSSCARVARRVARELGLALELGRALFAQVMQIDRIEDQLRARRVQAREADVTRGDVMARQHDRIEFGAAFAEQLDRIRGPRRIQRFDAELLQRRRVALDPEPVVRQETRAAAELAEHAHQIDHAQRARILIRRRRRRIDDQHALRRAMRRCARDRRAGRGLARERELPLVEELLVVDRLEALDAGRRVGARRDAFEVHDGRGRLVIHLESGRAHREREIGVFVVRRRIARIEAAEPAEQFACAAAIAAPEQ